MFTVGEMRRALAGLDDEQPLMVIFFRKQDAEDLVNEFLTPAKWKEAAEMFYLNDNVDSAVCETVRDTIYELRKKKVTA